VVARDAERRAPPARAEIARADARAVEADDCFPRAVTPAGRRQAGRDLDIDMRPLSLRKQMEAQARQRGEQGGGA